MLVALLGSAPMQCGSEPDPSRAMEETPAEALYRLAQQFAEQGDREAWASTLRFLIADYPSSRFAEMARVDLERGPLKRGPLGE